MYFDRNYMKITKEYFEGHEANVFWLQLDKKTVFINLRIRDIVYISDTLQ